MIWYSCYGMLIYIMCFGVTEDLLKEGDVPVADLLEREVYSYV